MRSHIILLAAALTLGACAAPRERAPTLEPRTVSSVRLYRSVLPRCPFRELGTVTGRRVRDLQSAAFGMRANAVLLERSRAGESRGGPLTGTAIQFLSIDCRG